MQFISNTKWNALQQQMKALQTNTINRFSNFTTQIYPVWKQFEDAYQTMDMVYSVVKKLATNAAMIPFYGYDKKKDTDLPETDKLVIFIETLDFEQKELMYTYLWDKGEAFGYLNSLDEGVNQGLRDITFLHPGNISLVLSKTFPVQLVRYIYHDLDTQEQFDIELEDMAFIKFPNPTKNKMLQWRGLSPADVLARTLTRVSSEDDVTVAQLQNGGIPSIVYDETPGLAPEVIGQRRDNFGRFIKNQSNKGAPYFSANKLGVIQLGSTLIDLNVTELGSADFGRVCNAYGVSTILFNDKSASTESNVREMKAEMFENTIIPNVERVVSGLNKSAVPKIKTNGKIKADYSTIKVLMEDEAKKASGIASKHWTTINEKREEDGYDQITGDPLMDKIIIPSGYMLLDDLLIAIPDVDNAAGDYIAPTDANKNPKVVPLKTGTNG